MNLPEHEPSLASTGRVTVRTQRPGERTAVRDVITRSFEDAIVADLAEALQDAARTGLPMVFLEGSPRYYRRFGFEPAGRDGFTAPSVRIPDAAFQVVLLPSYQEWMTGALVYAEPFWVFDCVGLRDPSA